MNRILMGLLFIFATPALASSYSEDAPGPTYPSLFTAVSATALTMDGVSSTNLTLTGGASQSGNILVIENNAGTDLFEVGQYGDIYQDVGAAQYNFGSTWALRDIGGTAGSGQFLTYGSTVASGFNFGNVIAMSATSSAQQVIRFTASSFVPTSGAAVYNSILGNPTINQTGGANGITSFLYVNPTITAAADWRDIRLSGAGTYSLSVEGAAPIKLPYQAATTPTEPFACAAGTVGSIQFVDKTDDSGAAAVCGCGGSSDDGAGTVTAYDWLSLVGTCPY